MERSFEEKNFYGTLGAAGFKDLKNKGIRTS